MKLPEAGDRIRMVGVMDDPHPIEVGSEGVVRYINEGSHSYETQIFVDWDVPRSLILLASDPFVIID